MTEPEPNTPNSDNHRVSVIIPAYQAAGHIARALESVFAQTFSSYEVIVINDGSPDTPQLLAALGPYMNRIRYIEQANQGPSAARNSGIRAATGAYVAFLDSDDCWWPAYLDAQVRLLEGPPRRDLVYSNAQRVGPLAGRWPTCMDASPSNGAVDFYSLLREQCTVVTSFTVARRQAVIDAGLFDPAFRRSEDFDLWIRMAHQGAVMDYHRTVLGTHALSEEGLSGDRDALREGQIAVYRKALNRMNLSREEFALIQSQVERCEALVRFEKGKEHLISRQYRQAAVAIGQANLFYRRFTLRLVLALLRLAPGAVRRIYLFSLRMKPIFRRARKRLGSGSLQTDASPPQSLR